MRLKVKYLVFTNLSTTTTVTVDENKIFTRLPQANLAGKNDISNFLKKKKDFDDKLKILNKKVTSNKSKHLLVENE